MQRPLGWTSADAAGLPITPGLIKVAEIRAGRIDHAIRFTSATASPGYAFPASHLVTMPNQPANAPWMGLRARLRASYACSSLVTAAARTVCTAMKTYGLILADVGTSWYIGGEVRRSLGDAFHVCLPASLAAQPFCLYLFKHNCPAPACLSLSVCLSLCVRPSSSRRRRPTGRLRSSTPISSTAI